MNKRIKTSVVVIGGGPGGYTAAFRAADLKQEVILIEQHACLGGVCLNVGCIPTKALLHVAKLCTEIHKFSDQGLIKTNLEISKEKIVAWKDQIVKKLTNGLSALAKQRKIEVIQGVASFVNANELLVISEKGEIRISFDKAIIAVGSKAVKLPLNIKNKNIFTSNKALDIDKVDGSLLVIGGGIIGLEMATVYTSFGTDVTIAETNEHFMVSADYDLVKPLENSFVKKCRNVYTSTRVLDIKTNTKNKLIVTFDGDNNQWQEEFDNILVSIGRSPNSEAVQGEKIGLDISDRGYINVNKMMQTNIPHIYAIGDVVGQPMLAHSAIMEGRIAAENLIGKKRYFEPASIPSVAYTNPEIAWVGVTEKEAKEKGLDYEKGVFPWLASGKALIHGHGDGVTKLIFDKKSKCIIGAGITGACAGDLISELALAIEMNCHVEDISLTIHPHPTLSETISNACEVFEGTVTDLYLPK